MSPEATKPRRRRARIPKTVRDSRYSIYSRHRARYALSSYRQRFGLSPEDIRREIEDVLGVEKGNLFSDRQLVSEFLSGSEPSDEKISVIVEYLNIVDPDLIAGFTDDGFIQLLGDVFTEFFLPYFGRIDYERAKRSQDSKNIAGLYVDCLDRESSPDREIPYNPEFILLRNIENAPYLLCDEIRFESHKDIWRITTDSEPSEFNCYGKKIFGEISIDEYKECLSARIGKAFHLLEEQGATKFVEVISKGICIHADFYGFMFMRDVLRQYPTITHFEFQDFDVFETNTTKYMDLRNMGLPKDEKAFFLRIRHPKELHRIRSDVLEYHANKIPWTV